MILAALTLGLAQAPASAPASLVLPAGTPVHVVTVDALDSRSAKQGQRFALRIDEDVSVGPSVVIQRGTAAVGEVEAVSGKGMVGQAGKLVLRPLFIEIAGQRVNLVGANEERGKDATAGVAVGAILVSPLSMFITGKSASVPAGSPLPARVRTEVTLPAVVAEPAPKRP